MDEEKKKQINDAIAVLRDMCEGHGCSNCPMFKLNCYGSTIIATFPLTGKTLINIFVASRR